MAKRGQRYPYRIKFRYPNDVKGTICLMTPDDVVRERDQLCGRGATVEIYKVYENGIWDQKATITPDEWLDERVVKISRRAAADIIETLDWMAGHLLRSPLDADALARVEQLREHIEAGQ